MRIGLASLRADRLFLLGLAILLIGAGLGLRRQHNIDEMRFLGVALEMLQNGSWLIPHRAGEIYPDKPPLFMWAVAAFIQLTGLPRVALYLPGMIAGCVTLLCIHDLGRRLWSRRIGFIAGLLFLATWQTFSVLRTGQIDSLLILWTGLGFYGLCRHLLLGPAWGWYYLACAAMGFGVISKGVGFLPALMLILYFYAVRQGWRGVVPMPGQTRAWLLGAVLALAVVLLWLGPMLVTALHGEPGGQAYVRDILFRQTAQRYVRPWIHHEPFWFYPLEVIPLYWLPTVLALPWLLPAWRRQLAKRDGRVLVLLGWVLLVVLFFSLSGGKRRLYIYPALPAFVLACAQLVPWLLHRWFARRPRLRTVFLGVVLLWFCGWFGRGFFDPLYEGPNPREVFMHHVAERTGGAELLLIHWREGSWLFAQQPIAHFGFHGGAGAEQAVAWLRENPQAYALMPEDFLLRCFDPGKALRVTPHSHWFVTRVDADNGQCQALLPEKVYRFTWDRPL
ncbi:Undecaprenyl phosphate-alpha-4-amino-4-deoxy-L-arabinose arabinosyl transferase [compost metagenome]